MRAISGWRTSDSTTKIVLNSTRHFRPNRRTSWLLGQGWITTLAADPIMPALVLTRGTDTPRFEAHI